MGRHSAGPGSSTGAGTGTANSSPVTDPHLFDRPLAVIPAPPRPLPPAPPASPRLHDATHVEDEPATTPYRPMPVRTTGTDRAAGLVPQISGSSLMGAAPGDAAPRRPQEVRYARTGPVPLTDTTERVEKPTRKRELALAAAALAVVGVMSGAAALLPSTSADAQTGGGSDPVTSPVSVASGSASDAGSASTTTASTSSSPASAAAAGPALTDATTRMRVCHPGERPGASTSTSTSSSTSSSTSTSSEGTASSGASTAPTATTRTSSVAEAFSGSRYVSGMVLWQTRNVTLDDVQVKGARSGIDFERASGRVTLNRPVFSGNKRYDLRFATDWTGGTVVINDPVLAAGAKLRIALPLRFRGVANAQRRADIHVYVGGVDRTSDLVTFV